MSNAVVLLDALAQKAARIERCVARVREEFDAATFFNRLHALRRGHFEYPTCV